MQLFFCIIDANIRIIVNNTSRYLVYFVRQYGFLTFIFRYASYSVRNVFRIQFGQYWIPACFEAYTLIYNFAAKLDLKYVIVLIQ